MVQGVFVLTLTTIKPNCRLPKLAPPAIPSFSIPVHRITARAFFSKLVHLHYNMNYENIDNNLMIPQRMYFKQGVASLVAPLVSKPPVLLILQMPAF